MKTNRVTLFKVSRINKWIQFFILAAFLLLSSTVPAVDFSFTDTDGENHKLSQYKGKWVLVNFWATWCPPCRKEIPDLSDFHLDNEDAVVIGVNYEPGIKDERLQKFMALYLVSYPITRVNDEIIDALGEPRGLPTSILIDPQGNVAKKLTGMVTERKLNQLILQFSSMSKQEK
ncbi:MAG: TlpA family protein disulfide reductase [Gammaproteobacteria bacterium]|nr:TlpA family protein disulfide reductase [Gammaproteobacteria bacterium]